MRIILLCSIFLIQYSAVRAETYVHPVRDDLDGRTFLEVGIPKSTYTNGLVFYMDAAAGDYNAGASTYFIPDLSAEKNDATQTGIAYQPNPTTNGFVFDGVDDNVTLGDLSDFDLSPNQDQTLIFKGVVCDEDSVSRTLYDKRNNVGGTVRGIFLRIRAGTATSSFYIGSGTISIGAIGPANLVIGNSYDIAAVVDRDGDLSIVVDGVIVVSVDISAYAASDLSTTSSVVIGNKAYAGSSLTFFDGSIEAVYAFDRVLTTNEIQQLCQ